MKCRSAVRSVYDNLSNHGIVLDWDVVTRVKSCINTNSVARWKMHMFHHTRTWHKVLCWNFCVDSAFNGMSLDGDIFLRETQWFSHGYTNLFYNEICASYHLRYTMFHLDSGIHLHKVEVAMTIHNIFDGSRISISHCFCCKNRILVHLGTDFFVDGWRWRFFDQFLMISLYGTVSLSQCHYVSVFICHNLNLHMTWIFDKFLNVHGVVTEGIGGFSLCHVKLEFKFIPVFCHTHSLAATAGGGFDHNRITDSICQFFSHHCIVDWFFRSRNNRNSRFHHGRSCLGFISHLIDYVRFRPDKGNAVFFTFSYKFTIF